MKVLLVDVNYTRSSTGKIVYDIASQLIRDNHEVKVLYGRGDKYYDAISVRISSKVEVLFHALMTRISGITGCFSYFSTKRAINEIERFNPDVVHLHELHGYYINYSKLISYLKAKGVPVIWTFHCEFAYTGKCGHSYLCDKFKTECRHCPQVKSYPKSMFFDFTNYMFNKKKQDFSDFNKLSIVTPSNWLRQRVKQSFLSGYNVSVINNGIDTEKTFFPRNVDDIKNKMCLNDKKVVLSVAPNIMSESKGGKWVVEVAKKFGPEYVFILVGVDDVNTKLPKNVITIKQTKNQDELAEYYTLADLFLICSRRENFPTTCLEALACGTPVIGFDEGGTSETATHGTGKFVKYGDVAALVSLINRHFNEEESLSPKNIRAYAEQRYSKQVMYKAYLESYKKIG